MNKLIAKAKVPCNTCGCTLRCRKTITVQAADIAAAKIEANKLVREWVSSLSGRNCSICATIIREAGQ